MNEYFEYQFRRFLRAIGFLKILVDFPRKQKDFLQRRTIFSWSDMPLELSHPGYAPLAALVSSAKCCINE